MCLIIVHLGEGGEKLLEMLCSGRVAVRGLGPVYESHPDAVFLVVLPNAVGGRCVEAIKELHYNMVFVVCQEVESLLRISTLVSNRHKASFDTTAPAAIIEKQHQKQRHQQRQLELHQRRRRH